MTRRWHILILAGFAFAVSAANGRESPYSHDLAAAQGGLASRAPSDRAAAAETLAFMRAYSAGDRLAAALKDDDALVRREAAMALAWCGARRHVAPLLARLDDADWTVRQAASVALCNLTGMELPFDALAEPGQRSQQAARWREWWAAAPENRLPDELLAALRGGAPAGNLARGCKVTASSTYKGPPGVLTDGRRGGFWQTKNVPFPQWCTVDLGAARTVARVVVRQYGTGFCMTDYAVAGSTDGREFRPLGQGKGLTPVALTVAFEPRKVRYVRITSFAGERDIYPTTFREVEVYASPGQAGAPPEHAHEAKLRAARAAGSLGGGGASQAVAEAVLPYVRAGAETTPAERAVVQAGLRSLGRLGDAAALPLLIDFLGNVQWARYAADALGDFGGAPAAAALIAAYPRYARDVNGKEPQRVPPDDRTGLTHDDRMYETPFAIASALARLAPKDPAGLAGLREIAPLLVANMPLDHDGAMLYEREAWQRITASLLEPARLRQAVCEAAFVGLGQPRRAAPGEGEGVIAPLAKRLARKAEFAAAVLGALCVDRADGPRLIDLLGHRSGWVRINAAKALMFMGERSAAAPLAKLLGDSKSEAEYGYFGRFLYDVKGKQGQDEYDDPPPRWREAFVRALGRLGGGEHAGLLVRLLNDDRSAPEIRFASAVALDELGTPEALAALRDAEAGHPFHSIRLVAREALWRRSMWHDPAAAAPGGPRPAPGEPPRTGPASRAAPAAEPEAVVFIKGDNRMPNRFQIDAWRQTYSTTDSGPTYRLGRNLYVLRPARPGGAVAPLTKFADGYVADCEVSWDARRVIFARRGGAADPWWHIWEVGVDGKGLRQLTRGAHHDVQPAYLPDGRIVFSSTRIGLRDEYHGYLATGLTVMNARGGGIRCIGFNLGRDDEPAVMGDGRILFGRLDLFYSRLKTERTIQAVLPDGTRNVTLYGPERRDFWRKVTKASGERGWGEVPSRHRVLRLTQPQPLGGGRVLCASTGGLVVVGPSRYEEHFIPHDKNMAVTSPFPLGDGRILCAATKKTAPAAKGPKRQPAPVDLALYVMDAASGRMTLLYNDPDTAEFEPRPVVPRRRPPVGAERRPSRAYTARLFCRSTKLSREPVVARRGKLVRVIEGMPVLGRHATHRSPVAVPAWKNHTGTHARVLGTVPLAADGSFFLEVPADRLIHLQVLDADRRVVGNQLVWMYARPGETRSCIGCHEPPDTSVSQPRRPLASRTAPLRCLPDGGEFTYRAKVWIKGMLSDEAEHRTRSARAVSVLARP